jgi:hypothetical protein
MDKNLVYNLQGSFKFQIVIPKKLLEFLIRDQFMSEDMAINITRRD